MSEFSEKHEDGVHYRTDSLGNIGFDVLSSISRTLEVFTGQPSDDLDPLSTDQIANLVQSSNGLKRKLFVVVDPGLGLVLKDKVKHLFYQCHIQGIVESYEIMELVLADATKTLTTVATLIEHAKHFGMRRRDIFVAAGSAMHLDMVGFAAATYRRSTPFIAIPTSIEGVLHAHNVHNRVSLHFVAKNEVYRRDILALHNVPLASLAYPQLISLDTHAERMMGFLLLLRIAIFCSADLFSYLDENASRIFSNNSAKQMLLDATSLSLDAIMNQSVTEDHNFHLVATPNQIISGLVMVLTGSTDADYQTEACSLAFTAALSHKNQISDRELEHVLRVLRQIGVQDLDKLKPSGLLDAALMFNATEEKMIVPRQIGKATFVDVSVLSRSSVESTMHRILHAMHVDRTPLHSPMYHGRENQRVSMSFKSTINEHISYSVLAVPNIFAPSNLTLSELVKVASSKSERRVLVVVDDYKYNSSPEIDHYFRQHNQVNSFVQLLLLNVSSQTKDLNSVLRVVESAINFAMCNDDLFIVVGGGTLMDVVGFAAAIYKGGTPYIRIPTTLLGMIDAGVGVKVGVNVESHKSSIGRYYAPVACLNDRETFLKTLPTKEVACGLAEAMKMAIVRSEPLFDLIETHLLNIRDASYADELIRVSIYEMLLELQPNFLEHELRRVADFGHEFGHIVESNSNHTIPHGECVAIGISIASTIANLKGLLSTPHLDRILDALLAVDLPIYTTLSNYCCANILWAKISTSGVEHKDGKLYLTIPSAIGTAHFIDELGDISKEIVAEAVLRLERRSQRHETATEIPTEIQSTPSSRHDSASPSEVTRELVRSASRQTIAIIGASGDLGSALAQHILDEREETIICLSRPPSLHRLYSRLGCGHDRARILLGDALHLPHLQKIIREADTLVNMAGMVSLGFSEADYAQVLAVNGFAQGIICHLIIRSGSASRVKLLYPSTQRVHLLLSDSRAPPWIAQAIDAFSCSKSWILEQRSITQALVSFATDFLVRWPVPAGINIYELSKLLGERMVSSLKHHSILRISGVYGPGFSRGFVQRAIHPQCEETVENSESRDFIFIDDVVQVMLNAAASWEGGAFDLASGESRNLTEVWALIRSIIKDDAKLRVTESTSATQIELHTGIAKHLLGREFTSLNDGIRKVLSLRNLVRSTEAQIVHSPLLPNCSAAPDPKPARQSRNHVVIDVGATYIRSGIMSTGSSLLPNIKRSIMPSRHLFPNSKIESLQERCIEEIIDQVSQIIREHQELVLEDVGVAFGAVISNDGIISDSSIMWGSNDSKFNLQLTLSNRMPQMSWTVVNDVSAAAWRYIDRGRFCLITVSSGLSNKVFDSTSSHGPSLNLDSNGLGGEMGHVVVEPRAVDALVRSAREMARTNPETFEESILSQLTSGDPESLNAKLIGRAVIAGDRFALALTHGANLPCCPCGTIADLCSFSSGRAALNLARQIADSGCYDVDSTDIDDSWLASGIQNRHPLAMRVLSETTYPLALRILQLAADIGLHKFILVGGYAIKTGKGVFLQTVRSHLVNLCSASGFFKNWTKDKIDDLVCLGKDDDLDGLIGVANYIRHQQKYHLTVEKSIGSPDQTLEQRLIPMCGARQVLTKVVFAGICTTDLQILRGDRGLEPDVLGHEGVCRIVETGASVRGVRPGDLVVLNPNNPIDDLEKLGHNSEGFFQQYFKFGQEVIDRQQVLEIPGRFPRIVETLIEPLSCVTTAQERVKDKVRNKRVLVIGAGLMGLLFVMTSRKAGASDVYLANRSKGRLDFAVASRIIEEDKTLMNDAIGSEIWRDHRFDMIFVCVSLGQGAAVAQRATSIVSDQGCIYLYAGFQPGDTLTTDSCQSFDLTPIRVRWMTEKVVVKGRPIFISGHRGTRHEDLLLAAKQIRKFPIEFSKILSHIISLDAVPQIMETLSAGGLINGVVPQRVVVDVQARSTVVESISDLPLRHLIEATRKPINSIADGNLFRHIGFDKKQSMIGWAIPPYWRHIVLTLAQALRGQALCSKRHFVFVATGNWGFAVQTVRDLVEGYSQAQIHVLQSLDPELLKSLLFEVDSLENAVFIGVTQSGTTMETISLMTTVSEIYSKKGLDFVNHCVWLTDLSNPTDASESGEHVLRNSANGRWASTEMYPLDVRNQCDINALFCAPHSFVVLLALALRLDGDLDSMSTIWQTYLAHRENTSRQLLPKARSLVLDHIEDVAINLMPGISLPSLKNSLVQMIEQGLGSKRDGFNPRVVFGDSKGPDEPKHASIKTTKPVSDFVLAMLTLNAFSIFTAAVAYHMEIVFVTHPKVDLYKSRMGELITRASSAPNRMDAESIKHLIADFLAEKPHPRRILMLKYGSVEPAVISDLEEWLTTGHQVRGDPAAIEIHDGETWNHSRFQAAVNVHDSIYLCLSREPHQTKSTPYGAILDSNAKSLRVMAQATAEVLGPYGLFLPLMGISKRSGCL